jgi:hypothetical protein
MSRKAPLDAVTARSGLQSLVEHFSSNNGHNKVELWTLIAGKLSRVVDQQPPWTWRYPQGVLNGTIQPSRKFAQAVNILGAAIDDVPVALARTSPVQVYAITGTVKPGSVVMGRSKNCETPGCRVVFVPNVPWRTKCPICSSPKNGEAIWCQDDSLTQ